MKRMEVLLGDMDQIQNHIDAPVKRSRCIVMRKALPWNSNSVSKQKASEKKRHGNKRSKSDTDVDDTSAAEQESARSKLSKTQQAPKNLGLCPGLHSCSADPDYVHVRKVIHWQTVLTVVTNDNRHMIVRSKLSNLITFPN